MTAGVQDDLRRLAVELLERRGALVDWPAATEEGSAVLPPEMAADLGAESELVPLSCQAHGQGLCVSLANDFLETAGRWLEAEPRAGRFRAPELYLKRGQLDEAVRRAFTWLNAKVRVGEGRPETIEYHTWWFHASLASEDKWETRFAVSLNARTGVEVGIPDPLGILGLEPHPCAAPAGHSTYERAVAIARGRLPALAAGFFSRMDGRLARDQKRLRDYYGALLREADQKKSRANVKIDPAQVEARKRAVHLELRRKLAELDERYAIQAVLTPVVLVRAEVTVLAVDLSVFRKRAQRSHVAYWNPLLKQFEPMACSRCRAGSYALSFTNEEVEPLCRSCAARPGAEGA